MVRLEEHTGKNGFDLSDDGLTVELSGNSATIVRSSIGRFVGKFYWEVHVNKRGAGGMGVGIHNNTLPMGSLTSSRARMYYASNGNKYPENSSYGENQMDDDVVSVLLDLDNGTLEFWRNGETQGVSHTDIETFANGGAIFASISWGSTSTNHGEAEINFGKTPFEYEIPMGYIAFDGGANLSNTMIKVDGNTFMYHTPSGWNEITAPTEDDFKNLGMPPTYLPTISKSSWSKILEKNKTPKFVSYVPHGGMPPTLEVAKSGKGFRKNVLPKGQLLIQKEDFITTGGVEEVIVANLEKEGKDVGAIKIALSGDGGQTWRTYRNSSWEYVNKTRHSMRSMGMDLDELQHIPIDKLLHLTGDRETIMVMYFLEEDIKDLEYSEIRNTKTKNESVLYVPQIRDMSMYVLNTLSTIEIKLEGKTLIGSVSDDDQTKVRYRVKLNGKPYFPANGEFTELMPSPANINVNIDSKHINLGKENTIQVEFEDYWGATDTWSTKFIGDYVGLIFKDEDGNAYSTETGDILKHLEIGTLIAGQVSSEHEIEVHNSLGYDVVNPMVIAQTEHEGVHIQLSKENTPFVQQDSLTWKGKTLKSGGKMSFYTRIDTEYGAKPKLGGEFTIRVYADRKEEDKD